jgi:hypothetical protein
MGKAAVLGAGAAAGALVGMAFKSAEATDRVDKLSQKIGMSREGFQEWEYVLSQNGMEIDTLQTGMKTLVTSMDQAIEGTGAGAESFEKLGISVLDASGNVKSQETVFNEAVTALQGMEDGAEKAKIANDLFGRSGSEMAPLINGASESVDALKQKAHDLGIVMSDEAIDSGVQFTDTIDSLKRSFGAVATEVGVAVMPAIENLANWAIENMPAIKETAETAFNKIGDAIQWVKDNSDWLIPVLATMLGGFVAFKIIKTINTLFLAFKAVQMAVAAAGGIMNAVMAANPFILVAAAIGVVIGVGVLLYKNWDTISAKAKDLWASINETFDKIKTTITEKIEGAKEAVKSAIDKIKGFFNFEFKWPKLKMPKFSIKGSMNPIKWLTDGVPKLSVNWNAAGAIFDKPTIFSTPYGYQGVGEAGPEAVAPVSKLQEYIKDAVGNTGNTDALLIDILKALRNMQIVLDTGVIAGAVQEENNFRTQQYLGGVGVV